MPNHQNISPQDGVIDLNMAEAVRADPRLGSEIRALRKIRKLTLDQLAGACDLSTGFLSQIERGQNRPSVTALYRLSRTLGVSISWFFFPDGGDNGPAERNVVRETQRRAITYDNGIRDELLTPNLAGKLELLRCSFPPGTGIDSSYSHEGEEAGLVLEGELELWVGEDHHHLRAGDSFSFQSALPHRYRNPGTKPALVIWAITPPSF